MFVLVRAVTYAALFIGFVLVYLSARFLSWSGVVEPATTGAPCTGKKMSLLALSDVWSRDGSCAGHRTGGHRALSAMLTVSQLSKSFAGRALFDDVSLQVNQGDRIKFQS